MFPKERHCKSEERLSNNQSQQSLYLSQDEDLQKRFDGLPEGFVSLEDIDNTMVRYIHSDSLLYEIKGVVI